MRVVSVAEKHGALQPREPGRGGRAEDGRAAVQDVEELEDEATNGKQAEKDAKKEYDKSEDDLKALQSVGQIIGEVL